MFEISEDFPPCGKKILEAITKNAPFAGSLSERTKIRAISAEETTISFELRLKVIYEISSNDHKIGDYAKTFVFDTKSCNLVSVIYNGRVSD